MVKLIAACERTIEYSFYLLLFLVPIILTPINYELFEFNKMMLTYVLTVIIVGAWLTKMVVVKQFSIQRTPFDIPLLLFAISQLLSAFFSIDRHVSLWGYYSRFHGGLLSTLSYITLYYAFASNLDKKKVLSGLRLGLLGGVLVAAYGVAEHFGIDDEYWVQDVKNRVFSTLGQPNWLAAYLSVLIPISLAFGIQFFSPPGKTNKVHQVLSVKYYAIRANLLTTCYLLLAALCYLALLYTKSRSGFLGFWSGNLIFWGILFFKFRKGVLKWFLILNSTFLILTFFTSSPFEQINRYATLNGIREKITHASPPSVSPPTPGGTESGEIRRIVWRGAIDIWRHYPIFGSGVETFAFSYYQFRPVEHNLTSEWDFLYNKAHNEYLNFLATTGAFGLGSYLLLIGWFIVWFLRKFSMKKENSELYIVNFALLAGYVSILFSNFFGFSVVAVALFFFLIPTLSFILSGTLNPHKTWSIPYLKTSPQKQFGHEAIKQNLCQWAAIAAVLLSSIYSLLTLSRFWLADIYFARGVNFNQQEAYEGAYDSFKRAIKLNSSEPFYHDELSVAAAALAIQTAQEKETTQAAQLAQEAIGENQKALETSPRNVNFWKTRTRVFYTLAALDEGYNQPALEAIQEAQKLAPTDAKVSYNLAILYGRVGELRKAIETLQETVRLKSDYRDARYGLALYLKANGEDEEAIRELKYILEKISSEDTQAKNTLEEWQ